MSIRGFDRKWICALLASAVLVSERTLAQDHEPSTYQLTIASQPLSGALQEFARQTGLQVIFFSEITDGLRSPTLEGRYTVPAAISAMLGNSRLTFRIINANTVQIQARTGGD